MSSGRPLRDALTALAASDHSDLEIRKLLIQMGNGSTDTAQTTERGEEEEFWEAEAAKEDDAVLIAPASISLDVSVSPTIFAACWATQGPTNS